jgi:hypothetical protein
MIEFNDFMEFCKLRAIACALEPNMESIWRRICREYSLKFHTPLHLVHELDPDFILTNLYETDYTISNAKENTREYLDVLYRMKDPNYEELVQEDLEDLVDAVMMKEMKRKGEVRGEVKPEKIWSDLPKSGGRKFTDLEKLETESESTTFGFKD